MTTISIASIVTGAFLASSLGGGTELAGLIASAVWVGLNVLVRL